MKVYVVTETWPYDDNSKVVSAWFELSRALAAAEVIDSKPGRSIGEVTGVEVQ